MKWKRQGMLTVEASLVVTMAILVTGLMLSLSFYMYQRCWYTQAACETAFTGSFCGVLQGNDPVQKGNEKWKIRKEEFYLKPIHMASRTEGNKNMVRVHVEGETKVWGRAGFRFQADISKKVIRPVPFIRKAAAIKEIGE